MDTLTLELPTPLISKIAELKIPTERIHSFVVQALELFVLREAKSHSKVEDEGNDTLPSEAHLPFSKSAIPFIDELITENQALFEELANL